MSTKTTFKRVALVAVAALGFGMLSVAPSNAYTVEASFRTLSWGATPAATGTTLVEWSAVVKVNGSCGEFGNGPEAVFATTTAQLDAAPIGSNLLLNSPTWSTGTPTGYTNTNATAAVAAFSNEGTGYKKATQVSCSSASSALVGYSTVKFTPDKAGVYTLVLVPLGATTGALTTTVTVSDPAPISAAGSVVRIAAGAVAPTADTDAVAVTGTKVTTGADEAARISVVAGNSTTADTSIAGTLSASISGSGLITWTSGRANGVRAASAAAAGKTGTLYVYSDNTSGVGTITISSGSTVLATKTVTFYGDVASVTVTPMAKSIVDTADGVATGDTAEYVGVVSAKDAAGVSVPVTAGLFTVSSSTEKTAQSVTDVQAVTATAGTYNGVKVSGSSVVLVADPTATKTGAKTLTLTHTATKVATTFGFSVALLATSSLTVTNNQGSTVPGQKITYTVTSKDAGGNPTPDGSHDVSITTSLSQSMAIASPTPLTFSGGVATFDLYAPNTPGVQTVTVTSDTVSASTTSDIVDLVQPATDAAAEATDAANAATDAANAAAEAADAATAAAQDAADAVAALSAQVAEMIASLKAQITALTNLVIKIQKKVKA